MGSGPAGSGAAAGPAPSSRAPSSRAPAGSAPGGADDLKRIRGIGPQNETRLVEAGVTRFAQIAAWSDEDAREMGDKLRFGGRIEREDWIGQAKVLAEGGETDFSKRVDAGSVRTSLESDDPRYREH